MASTPPTFGATVAGGTNEQGFAAYAVIRNSAGAGAVENNTRPIGDAQARGQVPAEEGNTSPNKGLQATADSVRSYLAPTVRRA